MKYYSTNKKSEPVSFKEATILGQPPDKGLYFPEFILQTDKKLISDIENLSEEEIAFQIIRPYVENEIPEDELLKIVGETVNFPIPLVQVDKDIYSLELFHGPTFAFKDVGARFMSRCLGYFLKNENREVTVLVATSGDTGGAVASGFYNVPGVEVVILYPSGKVSPVQEKQLTTPGNNIHALEVEGSFDDCQQMVKQAFADKDIYGKKFLTSANSINVARWLPQQFYYYFAYKQWEFKDQPPVISVPSGNFGNICAGILAGRSGLPVDHFIAACNINDIVSDYLLTGDLKTKTSKPTLSNAMDVGNPSNFVRILEIFHHHFPDLKKHISAYSITDEETLVTIRDVFKEFGYLLDPHGAVGYLSLQRYLHTHKGKKGIFLETAHPLKFPEAVEKATGEEIVLPDNVSAMIKLEKKSELMPAVYAAFKEYLLR